MMPDEIDSEVQRVRDEVMDRLRRIGIATTGRDSSEDLARLLDAVERFERTVDLKGGDLMVDEPVEGTRPVEADDASFVLPARAENESIDTLIGRIDEQRRRAARVPEP